MSPGPELDCSLATTRRPSADARDEVEEPGFGLRSEHRSKLTDVEIAEIEKNMPPEYPSIQGEDVQARPGSVHHLRKTTIAKVRRPRRVEFQAQSPAVECPDYCACWYCTMLIGTARRCQSTHQDPWKIPEGPTRIAGWCCHLCTPPDRRDRR